MADDATAAVIETLADGLRLQVGDLAADDAPRLLRGRPAAYVVGFAVGISRAMGVDVGNHTVRIVERGTRQGLPRDGDLGQRLADVATRLLLAGELTTDAALDAIRQDAEAEGRAFVDDNAPPSGLKDIVYE